MDFRTPLALISRPGVRKSLISAFGLLLLCTVAVADDREIPGIPLGSAGHSHKAVELNLRPIVARTTVPLTRPRRVMLDRQNRVIVTDWGAGTVVRISNGRSETLADELSEPSGLEIDAQGNIYVSQHASGVEEAGSVIQITPMGSRVVIATGLTGPTALAFDNDGHLLVACFHDNTIRSVSVSASALAAMEEPKIVAKISTPTGLAVDADGTIWASSSRRGAIYKIAPDSQPKVVARGLAEPSEVRFDAKGRLVVACSAGSELVTITAKGARTYARVPKGTIGLCFGKHDNLWLVNWDYRVLMSVTSTIEIPCPHCGKKIPVKLRPRKKPQPTGTPDV